MNKKNLLYLLILVLLLGVAGWLLTERNQNSTLGERKMDYNFTVPDTAAVDKIIISDKSPSTVSLTRGSEGWLVNGEYRARKDAIKVLLMTLNRMEMRNFIPEEMKPTVIKRMSVYGKEVKVYKNGRLLRHFYVGTEAHDEMATYMMIKGSDAPYAVHIPGFNGYLSSRFFTEPYLWKSRDITYMDPRNIREATMIYPDSLQASFRVNVFSPDSLFITNLANDRVVWPINIVKARQYLAALGNIKYEGAILTTDPIYARRDSLLASKPVFELELKDIDGKVVNVQGYHIKGAAETFDPELPASKFDPDRMHGFINEEQMVLLQYYGLRKVLQPLSYFTTR